MRVDPLSPFSLTPGAAVTLTPPPGIVTGVRLTNLSLLTALVTVADGAGATDWLPSGYKCDFAIEAGNSVTVAASTGPAGLLNTGQLLVGWLSPADGPLEPPASVGIPAPALRYIQAATGVNNFLYVPSPQATGLLVAASQPPTIVSQEANELGNFVCPVFKLPGIVGNFGLAFYFVLLAMPPDAYSTGSVSYSFAASATYALYEFSGSVDMASMATASGGIVVSALPAVSFADNTATDSGGQGQTLTLGNVSSVPSPRGPAFGQGITVPANVFGVLGASGPAGASIYQGAIAGTTQWTCEFVYRPSAADVAASANVVLVRRQGAVNEWGIGAGGAAGQLYANWWDAGGAQHNVISTATLVANGLYHIVLTWNGATLLFLVNGAAAGSIAMTSAQAPSAANGLTIYEPITGGGGVIDELRISGTARYTSTFTPPAGPFEPDPQTGPLYHFDGGPAGAAGAVSPCYTVIVPNPAAGSDWTYLLPFAARLVQVTHTLATAATVASRIPGLYLNPPGTGNTAVFPVSTTALTAGSACNYSGSAGTGGAPFTNAGVAGVGLVSAFGFPSLLLPAGTAVGSLTKSLQAGDTWANVALTFAPA